MTDLTQHVSTAVGKHFITLSCLQYPPSVTPVKSLAFSGFLVEADKEWFYVTAGHVLRDIRAALATGCSFDVWRFGEQAGANRFTGMAIPYEFNLDAWLAVRHDGMGLDYAAVHIGDDYRRQLQAAGVAAIGKDAWSDHGAEVDHWVLVGIPSETIQYDGQTAITARVAITPLAHAEEPAPRGVHKANRFYATPLVSPDAFFNDARDFGGGPVFSLKWDGKRWLYWVIGVQSDWYPTIRTMAISSFASVAAALEQLAPLARFA
jgi:hypothetical protein